MKRIFRLKWGVLVDNLKSQKSEKDIHARIQETIAERKRVLPEWEKLFYAENPAAVKDIHLQLKETIAGLKRDRKQYERLFASNRSNNFDITNKKAA